MRRDINSCFEVRKRAKNMEEILKFSFEGGGDSRHLTFL